MLFFFDYQPYIAIIGDIKESRLLPGRRSIQEQLQRMMDNINHEYARDVASPFKITLGDEFQGLLKSGASVVPIIDRIERVMFPVRFRFGIGIGTIATDLYSDTSKTDGQAYYLARETINALKISERKNTEIKINIAIEIYGNKQLTTLLNTTFSLLSVIKEFWTPRRVEIINAFMQSDGTQTSTAKTLGINQSNVQKALASSNFYTYREALQTITDILSDIKEDADA